MDKVDHGRTIILIAKLSGKFSKQALADLEKIDTLSEDQFLQIRKIVLDAFNDYKRQILADFGAETAK